ncbi:MAG TPA: stage II sporulation protein P [Virgibacillus sp.]|nr:stage II sporulation protein P [Virgibacillus sp.]
MSFKRNIKQTFKLKPFYQKSGIYVMCLLIVFVSIGILTTIKPAYRFSSHAITEWTSDIDSSTFLYLLGRENRVFQHAYPEDKAVPKLSTIFFQIVTNIKPDDPRSFLGQEVPGFSNFGQRIIVAGEGTSYANLSIESSPPLEEVLKDREAILDEDEEEEEVEEEEKEIDQNTGDRDVVFIYNTHNRESFLPHLPDETDPDLAYHDEVNITKVSEKLSKALQANGIGTYVDETDVTSLLHDKGWTYPKSYDASRTIVEEAVATNKDIEYIIDLHRDSLPKDKTTKEINGEDYAKILFVVGAEYDSYEKNLALATELHYLIEEKYPGLSRGVLTKEGSGTNGVFNQDVLNNSLTIEMGGYDNTLEELYRSSDALAEVFSDFYWDAEKVDAAQ